MVVNLLMPLFELASR